jgi:cardiolipin synthase
MASAIPGRPARATRALICLTVGALARVGGNLANLLTLSRLVCAVPLYLVIQSGQYELAFWVFLAAALTDVADGFIAKTFNGKTSIGAVLDPISDKVFLACLFLALFWKGALPAWLVAVVLSRDLLLVFGTGLLRYRIRRFRVEPLVIGKLCTFLQLVLVGFVLGGLAGVADTSLVEGYLIVAAAAVTIASTLAYIAGGFRVACKGEGAI